jgi:hypothetical protein
MFSLETFEDLKGEEKGIQAMKSDLKTSAIEVLIRGGGDLASGVAWRLHVSGFRVLITEIAHPWP